MVIFMMTKLLPQLSVLTDSQLKIFIACVSYWRVYDADSRAPAAKEIARITGIEKGNIWVKAHSLVQKGLLEGFKWRPTPRANAILEVMGLIQKITVIS